MRKSHYLTNMASVGAFLWLICVLSVASSAADPASAPPTPTLAFFDRPQSVSLLRSDARLDRRITLDEVGTPLAAVLDKIGNAELPLTAGSACAEQKLQVRLKDRPVRALMEALAQLLPGTWKPSGKGYRLEEDQKAVDYQARWWQLYMQERERALATLRRAILDGMRQPPFVPKPDAPDPEGFPPEMYQEQARRQLFWNLIPSDLQERIANQMVDTAYYRSGRSHSIGVIKEGGVVVPFSTLPPQARTLALESAARLLAGNKMGDPVAIRFNNIGLGVSASIATADGRWRDMVGPLHTYVPFIAPTLGLDHTGLPLVVERLGKDAPATWKQLAVYQENHVWANDPPRERPAPSLPPRRAEVLDWLADRAGLEFVADYYSVAAHPLTPAEKKQLPRLPLKRELDARAAEQDMSWKKRNDSLYLFRDNRWYRDNALEVPAADLQRLQKRLRTSGETPSAAAPQKRDPAGGESVPDAGTLAQLSLDADIVRSLTPWQIANGLTYFVPEEDSRTFDFGHPRHTWRPFALIAENVLTEYNTARFYAGLNQTQVTALLNGNLSVAQLNPDQLQQAMFVLPDLQLAVGSRPPETIRLGLRTELDSDFMLIGFNAYPGQPKPPIRIVMTVTPTANSN